jgi:hypothetical protein
MYSREAARDSHRRHNRRAVGVSGTLTGDVLATPLEIPTAANDEARLQPTQMA